MTEFIGTIRMAIEPYCLATVNRTPEQLDKELEEKYKIESQIRDKPDKLKFCHNEIMGNENSIPISIYYSKLCGFLRSGRIKINDFVKEKQFKDLKIDVGGEREAIKYLAWCIIKLWGDLSKKEPHISK